jgi:chromosome segregation ATPase
MLVSQALYNDLSAQTTSPETAQQSSQSQAPTIDFSSLSPNQIDALSDDQYDLYLKRLTEKNAALDESINNKKQNLDAKKQEDQQLDKVGDALNQSINNKKQVVDALGQSINNKKQVVDALNQSINNKKQVVDALGQSINNKRQVVDALNQDVKALQEKLQVLKSL